MRTLQTQRDDTYDEVLKEEVKSGLFTNRASEAVPNINPSLVLVLSTVVL